MKKYGNFWLYNTAIFSEVLLPLLAAAGLPLPLVFLLLQTPPQYNDMCLCL